MGCLGDQHRRSDRPLALESIDRQGISTRRGPVGTVPALRAVRRSRHGPSSVLRAGTLGCVVVLVGVSLRLPWAVPWTAVPGLALLAMTPSMSVELRVRRRRWTFTATDAALATAPHPQLDRHRRGHRQQGESGDGGPRHGPRSVSYTHLRAHETVLDLVCRLLL